MIALWLIVRLLVQPRIAPREDVRIVRISLPVSVAALCATGALGAGIDQSGQEVDLLFRDGNYARIGLGYWMPSVDGTDVLGTASGNVYDDTPFFSLGVRKELNDAWSVALLIDQPWGVELDYPGGSFAYAGTSAHVRSLGVSGLARYRIDDHFSLHGGLRATGISADVGLDGFAFGNMGYKWNADRAWGLGWVAGGAYEIPAIALRVALTYSSETKHEMDGTETLPAGLGLPPELGSTTDVTMPQSVNLDFQTGVAPDTLLYGTVRWVNWKDWTVAPPGFAAIGGDLVHFESNAFTYKLGLGRQLTDAFAAAIEVMHETPRDEDKTPLAPYDGYTAIAIGGTYSMPSGLDLTAGVSYNFLGNADVEANGVTSRFDDNRALAAALEIGLRF